MSVSMLLTAFGLLFFPKKEMKTNKSYAKRLKVTRNGKILGRKTGQNHFNAKESGRGQLKKSNLVPFHMTNKEKSRFLSNLM